MLYKSFLEMRMDKAILIISDVNDGDKINPFTKSDICTKIANEYCMANERPWKCCRERYVYFTIEILANVKIYDRICTCIYM